MCSPQKWLHSIVTPGAKPRTVCFLLTIRLLSEISIAKNFNPRKQCVSCAAIHYSQRTISDNRIIKCNNISSPQSKGKFTLHLFCTKCYNFIIEGSLHTHKNMRPNRIPRRQNSYRFVDKTDRHAYRKKHMHKQKVKVTKRHTHCKKLINNIYRYLYCHTEILIRVLMCDAWKLMWDVGMGTTLPLIKHKYFI